ncbi:MAG: hypothetical protein JNJ45_00605 [Chthonomonas sp.]|nr:hypothetical protein [Chthonomonas sp.]
MRRFFARWRMFSWRAVNILLVACGVLSLSGGWQLWKQEDGPTPMSIIMLLAGAFLSGSGIRALWRA